MCLCVRVGMDDHGRVRLCAVAFVLRCVRASVRRYVSASVRLCLNMSACAHVRGQGACFSWFLFHCIKLESNEVQLQCEF